MYVPLLQSSLLHHQFRHCHTTWFLISQFLFDLPNFSLSAELSLSLIHCQLFELQVVCQWIETSSQKKTLLQTQCTRDKVASTTHLQFPLTQTTHLQFPLIQTQAHQLRLLELSFYHRRWLELCHRRWSLELDLCCQTWRNFAICGEILSRVAKTWRICLNSEKMGIFSTRKKIRGKTKKGICEKEKKK